MELGRLGAKAVGQLVAGEVDGDALGQLAESVSSTAHAIGSCSSCEARSATIWSASAPASATTRISLGPARPSMPTTPKTARLARVTKTLPGPVILSTAGTLSVP